MNREPELGDVLFTASPGWIGRTIRWFQTHTGEEPTLVSHMGIFYDHRTVEEALAQGVIKHSWAERSLELMDAGTPWVILTPGRQLSQAQLDRIRATLDEQVGWRYSYAELGLQAADAILGWITRKRRVVFRKWGNVFRKRVICSKTAARPLIKAAVMPTEMKYSDPDDGFDYLLKIGWLRKDGWPVWRWSHLPH